MGRPKSARAEGEGEIRYPRGRLEPISSVLARLRRGGATSSLWASCGGSRWPVDETLLKIGGRWCYVFRAIDEHGQIIDAYLSDHRDAASARAFFAGDGRGRRDADPRHEP